MSDASRSSRFLTRCVRFSMMGLLALAFSACEKADHFRIRGDAFNGLTNADLVSLQRIVGAASPSDGRVWGIYATHASKFNNQPVIRACVITKFTHRDDTIAIAECVACYKAAPGYLKPARHRDGDWGSFQKTAERCVFVAASGKAFDFEELPTNPVTIRGSFSRDDMIGILRRVPVVSTVLDPRVEQGSSPDEAVINGVITIRRRSDGTW